METKRRTESRLLADQLERSVRGGAWHGPALAESIAGLDAREASARPIGSAHSILELVTHAAFWVNAARRRMAGETVTGIAPGEDWPRPEGAGQGTWERAVRELESAHRELVAAVAALDDERLDDTVPGSDPTLRGLLLGLLQHNAYHAGQITLLRKVVGGKENR